MYEKFKTPQLCAMTMDRCTASLGGWTVGMEGNCVPEQYGISLGGDSGNVMAMVEVCFVIYSACNLSNISVSMLRYITIFNSYLCVIEGPVNSIIV